MAVVRHQARGRTRSRRAPAPLPDASKPVEYAAFSRYVRRFKTRKFLRLVAKHQTLHWNQDRPLDSLLLKPHAGSLIAFEAMASWGAQGQVSPTLDDLRRLDALVIALDDPILTSPVLGASDDLMVRMSFQQFPYQHPPFNDTARLRPMFEREYPADKFQVVNKTLIDELLGTDVATYTDLAPFFLAAFMSNEGMFHPSWFEQENFAALNEILPPEHALRVFDRMSEDPDYFRRAARDNRAQESNRRQYDFNPFAAKPFVNLPEGFGLAPQPAFVTGRFSPSTIFYAGSAHFAQDLESKRLFFTELGDINEDYVRLQLAQLQDVGARLDGPSEYAPGKESVDASIVMGSDLLLIEVKSTRPVFAARGNADDYRKHLDRDIKRGFEQLEISWRLYKDGMLGHLPPDLTVHGFVVTPEPFYLANWTSIHQSLPSPSMPVAILSFTELEELVSGALHDRALTGFVHAATNPANGAMDADPMAAIEGIKRRNNGVSPRNPLLDLSFDTDRWSQIHERDG